MAHVIRKKDPYCSKDHSCDQIATSSFFKSDGMGLAELTYIPNYLSHLLWFFVVFPVCSSTFTDEIQPTVWQSYLGKCWVTWAVLRIQCKVSGCSNVCCKPPSVPLWCSSSVFCLLTGGIDHCWLWAGPLTLLCCVSSHKSPCSCLRHDAEIPSYHGSGAVAASSTVSDRVTAEHNVGRLKEPRVAQSWTFLVWEGREWTIRPVLPKPVKFRDRYLLTWGSWWISIPVFMMKLM